MSPPKNGLGVQAVDLGSCIQRTRSVLRYYTEFKLAGVASPRCLRSFAGESCLGSHENRSWIRLEEIDLSSRCSRSLFVDSQNLIAGSEITRKLCTLNWNSA